MGELNLTFLSWAIQRWGEKGEKKGNPRIPKVKRKRHARLEEKKKESKKKSWGNFRIADFGNA